MMRRTWEKAGRFLVPRTEFMGAHSGILIPASSQFDPWAATKFLCHADGANNGTVFTDQRGHAIKRNASVTTSTAQKKWGTASMNVASTFQSIETTSGSADFYLDNTTPWCLESWYYPTSLISAVRYIAGIDPLGSGTTGPVWYAVINSGAFIGKALGQTQFSTGLSFQANTWNHCGICWDGSKLYFFLNGAVAAQTPIAGNWKAMSTTTPKLYWGYVDPGTSSMSIGYHDDIRLMVGAGAALYTAAYTVPSAAFPDA